MPSLTVTEKEHWKDRIARKIDQKVEVIAAADPNLLDRVAEQGRLRALQSLGLAPMQAELDTVATQKKELEKRERQTHRAMLAVVRRMPVEEVTDSFYGCQPPEVTKALQKRQAVHEAELMAEDALGQQVLGLRLEKENLLDTVWLATSPVQLKQLWQKVMELLGEEQTDLQKKALAIGADGQDK